MARQPVALLDLDREEVLELRAAIACRRRELGDAAKYLHRLLDGVDHRLLALQDDLAGERRQGCILCGHRNGLDEDGLCREVRGCAERTRLRVRRVLRFRR